MSAEIPTIFARLFGGRQIDETTLGEDALEVGRGLSPGWDRGG